jgi:hypothetical protein
MKRFIQHATPTEANSWTKPGDDILASIERFCRRTLEHMR